MILIVGNNDDDLLYFETIMTNKTHEMVLKKYRITVGLISNQPTILLKDVYTNIVSSMVTSYLIEKRYILFIIKVGKVNTLSKNYRNGDIVLSRKIVGFDVDVTDVEGTKLGQIPGYSDYYKTTDEIRNMLLTSFQRRSQTIVKDCSVYSSNVHFSNRNQLEPYIRDNKILYDDVSNIVFDTESFGISIASQTYEIPFLSLNVVIDHVGDEFEPATYVKVLEQYTNVGKAVCNLISEIGSSDVMRGQ